MPETPRYPDGDPRQDVGGDREPPRRVMLWWAVGAVLVVLFIVLHLTGIFGPGAH